MTRLSSALAKLKAVVKPINIIAILITAVATTLINKSCESYLQHAASPDIQAKAAFAAFEPQIRKRERATYILSILRDQATNKLVYVLAFVYPPDVDIALGDNNAYLARLILKNTGGSIAHNVRVVYPEMPDYQIEAQIPPYIQAETKQITTPQSKAKEIWIQQIGKGTEIVISFARGGFGKLDKGKSDSLAS